ncbi:hypothetical protein RAA17_25700 [Komagataeibacter rhaeticus]|nr:hypothetical protein [Komagataeibacter rhaeticus]
MDHLEEGFATQETDITATNREMGRNGARWCEPDRAAVGKRDFALLGNPGHLIGAKAEQDFGAENANRHTGSSKPDSHKGQPPPFHASVRRKRYHCGGSQRRCVGRQSGPKLVEHAVDTDPVPFMSRIFGQPCLKTTLQKHVIRCLVQCQQPLGGRTR